MFEMVPGCVAEAFAALDEANRHARAAEVAAVVAGAIQTILRREAYPNPYEALKALTRTNEKMTERTIHDFVNQLDVNEDVKKELLAINPWNYTGV